MGSVVTYIYIYGESFGVLLELSNHAYLVYLYDMIYYDMIWWGDD